MRYYPVNVEAVKIRVWILSFEFFSNIIVNGLRHGLNYGLACFIFLLGQILGFYDGIVYSERHFTYGGNAAFERIAFILDAENPLDDREDAENFSEFKKAISFNNISFKYDDEYVLKDFSLTVPKRKNGGHSRSVRKRQIGLGQSDYKVIRCK